MSNHSPFSTWTALAYPLAAVPVLASGTGPAAGVVAAALIFLGLATFLFHWRTTELSWRLDHAAMLALFAVLATLAAGGPWTLALAAGVAAAVVPEYVLDTPYRPLLGAFVWISFAAPVGAGEDGTVGAALLALGTAYLVWHWEGDRPHGFWHVFTAVGIWFLYLGVV